MQTSDPPLPVVACEAGVGRSLVARAAVGARASNHGCDEIVAREPMPVTFDETEQLVTEHELGALLGRHPEVALGDLPVSPADADFEHSNRHLAGERPHMRCLGYPRRARPPRLCDERLHGRDCTSVSPVSEAPLRLARDVTCVKMGR